MSDVKVVRKESLSPADAALWLSTLSKAFAHGGEVTLPMGPGTLGLELPERVHAEFEVEVDGDEIEVEIEFKWSTAQPSAATTGPAEPPAA